MSKPVKTFNDYVVEGVLAKLDYGISVINNLKIVKDLYFVQEEYADVLASVRAGNIELIQQPNLQVAEFREYLVSI